MLGNVVSEENNGKRHLVIGFVTVKNFSVIFFSSTLYSPVYHYHNFLSSCNPRASLASSSTSPPPAPPPICQTVSKDVTPYELHRRLVPAHCFVLLSVGIYEAAEIQSDKMNRERGKEEKGMKKKMKDEERMRRRRRSKNLHTM